MLLILPLLAILFLTILFLIFSNPRKNYESFRPPPGPKGLPIVGNLLQFDASNPQAYFARLGKIYGPILSLKIGRVPVVVIQSAKLAKEVLQTQDLNFCDRPPFVGMQKLSYNGLDIAFAPYNAYFREVKKLSVVHLLSSKRTESFATIGQEEAVRMINKINYLSSTSKVVNLSELLMGYACSNICRVAFGQRYEDDNGTNSRSKFHTLLNEVQALFIAFFFSQYFPYCGWLDVLTGKTARLDKTFKAMDEFYEQVLNDHLDPNKRRSEREDIIDVLLHLKKDREVVLTLDHIKAVLMNIVVAGTDTSSGMVVWAMAELMRNPEVLKKVQEEIRDELGNKGCVEKSDLQNLKYFNALVKETLRLHPAVPLLVPREVIRKSMVDGYDIKPKTLMYVNAWAIGRDPESWTEAEKFMPERFLDSPIDYKGSHFELIPFGAGRRICPGLHLGVANMEIALANLLYSFDWELPPNLKKEDIDFDVIPGISMHKKVPLCLVPKKFIFHA